MNVEERHRWVDQNFPGARNTSWTKSREARKLNAQGVLIIRGEPGMLANDARRKAAALGDLAQRGKLETPAKNTKVPSARQEKALYHDTNKTVPLSTYERHKLIDQVHVQATKRGWSEKRKNSLTNCTHS
jgi:hypothetical protein